MIVQPEFLEHWKTRLLVEITGDESAPLCVIRLWAHCQTSRRWEFQDMTPAQLAAICRWGNRKPACHVALVKARFVDRFKKGFAAHDWQHVNAQLIQKWLCGKKGGRPAKPKTESEPAETGRFSPDTRTQTDKTRQTRQDGLDQNSTHNVNLVNHTPGKQLTKLTASAASMERIARDITSNKHGWSYDNCKVKPEKIVAASLKKVLQAHADKLTEKAIHECWQESVTRAHGATVDQLADNPEAYGVACFKEQLQKAVVETIRAMCRDNFQTDCNVTKTSRTPATGAGRVRNLFLNRPAKGRFGVTALFAHRNQKTKFDNEKRKHSYED